MAHKVFINLPVEGLDRPMAFFRSVGFDFNTPFSDETAARMVISEEIYAMLVIHYGKRLHARKSFARAVDKARPYRQFFPLGAPDRDGTDHRERNGP